MNKLPNSRVTINVVANENFKSLLEQAAAILIKNEYKGIKRITTDSKEVVWLTTSISIGKFCDDHGYSKDIATYKHYALLKHGEKTSICPLPSEAYGTSGRWIISLNPLYLNPEQKLHLSTRSVSTFDQRGGSTIEEAVESYNAEHKGNQWSDAEIVEIIKL